MKLSEADLLQLEEFGSIALPLDDVAVILQVNPEELHAACSEPTSLEHQRYNAGFLRLKAELLKSIKESATQGSNPAQTIMIRFIEQIENAKKDDY